jgi:60S ribosome subunit biogenesis protein NIP7
MRFTNDLLIDFHEPISIQIVEFLNMRPLTEPETKVLFEKLATYCGKGISNLISESGPEGDRHVFRIQVSTLLRFSLSTTLVRRLQYHGYACELLSNEFLFGTHLMPSQNSRVYYVRSTIANLATSVRRDSLLSLGTCLGRLTKTGKFRLHITALPIIAPHARYKVWVKPNGEMPFLYGGNVLKAHVGRWTEDCPEHQGVVVLRFVLVLDDTQR